MFAIGGSSKFPRLVEWDFNTVLSSNERVGYFSINQQVMLDFSDFMLEVELIDMGYK